MIVNNSAFWFMQFNDQFGGTHRTLDINIDESWYTERNSRNGEKLK